MEIEFLRSRSGSWVPVVDGTLLHSSVGPEREAELFISVEWPRIRHVRSIVALGLGGGFHLDELMKRGPFEVVVIESSRELASLLSDKIPTLFDKIDVLAGVTPSMIFSEPEIKSACSKPFAILTHPACYRLHHFYYSAILRELNQRTINGLKKLCEGNEKLHLFLESLDICGEQILTLPMIEEAMMRRGTGLDRESLIWMAMRELIT